MEKKETSTKEESVNSIIKSAMDKLKHLVETNTVIGTPVKIENTNLIPVSKINVGFVAGGGEVKCNLKKIKCENYPFAGGSGSGFTITPIGFLTITENRIDFISTDKMGVVKDWAKISGDFLKKVFETGAEKIKGEYDEG